MQAFLNGDFVDLHKCRISVLDRGFLFADGVYEVMLVAKGRIFAFERHMRRLRHSMEQIKINEVFTFSEWHDTLRRLADKVNLPYFSIYLQVTRGTAPRAHCPPEGIRPTVFAMPMEIEYNAHKGLRDRGVAVRTCADIRWSRCDIKSIALLPNVLARLQAVKSECYEAIFIRDGFLTEGASSNVFIVKDSVVKTPHVDNQKLSGITRTVILQIGKDAGIEMRECKITDKELLSADEIWLSATVFGILPASIIDGKPLPGPFPSPLVSTLQRKLDACIRDGKIHVDGD